MLVLYSEKGKTKTSSISKSQTNGNLVVFLRSVCQVPGLPLSPTCAHLTVVSLQGIFRLQKMYNIS